MPSLALGLVNAAREHGDRPAVRLNEVVLTYAELLDRAGRVAAGLQRAGLKPGDRVGLVMPNIIAYPVSFYGVLIAGGVVVPMNPLLKGREVEYYLKDSGAAMVIGFDPSSAEAKIGCEAAGARFFAADTVQPGELVGDGEPIAPVECADSDTAVILYTSGTTGQPKGAELTHHNLVRTSARSILVIDSDDVIMGCLPLFHVFGLTCGMNAAIAVGASLTLIPRFDPAAVLQMIERDRVTVFEGVPTMYSALLNQPGREQADVSTLRTCVSGGAALPVEVLRAFEKAFGCAILEGYGLSETSPVASFNMVEVGRKPGTIGVAIPGVELKLVDDTGAEVAPGEVGEIAIRGENVMKGYWGRPDATAEAIPDGWFRSGDLATVDADGFYTIVDRKKDLIIRGGYNVYPREIEEVLYEHPDVLEAAVVGIPDPQWGEEVAAAVSVRPGSTVDAEAIKEFVKERVAAYKYPRAVWIISELPKGPTGKILRREVRPPA
jgi:long-chain acyl-CoA synthetase